MQKKVCYIVSHVHKSLGFEWTAAGLKDKYDLSFILLNENSSPLEDFLVQQKIVVHRVTYRGKRDMVKAWMQTRSLLSKLKPDVVHCHLLDAQLIGLTASWLQRIPMRVYTRHNSNFHHVYHPRGVRYDRLSNRLSTRIVSISQATDHTLINLEGVPPSKIRKVHHGFDLAQFAQVPSARVARVRSQWAIPGNGIVIGVVARHIEWKGIQYILEGFHKLQKEYPEASLVMANAAGPYHSKLEQQISRLQLKRVIQIPFEEDVAALYPTFTVYVHTPVDSVCEAFGQTYVEALAAGIPSVFTLSGIASEFIVDGKNALVVPYRDSEQIFIAMEKLIVDGNVRSRLAESGRTDVMNRFGIVRMIGELEKLYDEPVV